MENRSVQSSWRERNGAGYCTPGTLEKENGCGERPETHLLDLYALLDLFSRLSQPKDYPKNADM